jgi:hypothetical protein
MDKLSTGFKKSTQGKPEKKDQDSENPRRAIPDVDYIIEVIREMAYILINKDKEFDIVIKLKGCLTDCNVITSDSIINSV